MEGNYVLVTWRGKSTLQRKSLQHCQ